MSGETRESMASLGDLGCAVLGFPSCPSRAGSDPPGLGDTTRFKSFVLMCPAISLLPYAWVWHRCLSHGS